MEPICVVLLVALGMRGVQTSLVNIYDRSYEKTTLKIYNTYSPSEIKFINSSIILFVRGKGYDVGTYDNLHTMWGVDEPHTPGENVNISDRYRNLLECEYNELVYLSTPREMYAVYTGNSSHTIRCVVDYYTSIIFIIGSTTEDARMGKLYVLNTGQYAITNFWITSKEIDEVGDRVTAVGLDPTNGKILIASEIESTKRSFELVLLNPLHKDVTTLSGFTDAVEKAEETLNKLFRSYSKKRLDRLIYEISQIRTEINIKKLHHPSTEINTNITCEDSQLQQLINITGNELMRLFNENIIGNETREQEVREIQCVNKMKKLRVEMSNFEKRIKSNFKSILPTSLGSSVDITEETCLEILNLNKHDSFSCSLTEKMDYKQLKYNEYNKVTQYAVEFLTTKKSADTDLEPSTVVTILGKNHLLSEVKVYFSEAPSSIEYRSFLSSLMLFINGRGYDIGRDFSDMRSATWFKPRRHDSFTDKHGNTLDCNNPHGFFSIRDDAKSYSVFPNQNIFIVQCHGDYEKSRAFIIASNIRGAQEGKFFVFDTKNYILNTDINVHEIKEVGDNITAVTVRPITGEVFLTKKVSTLEKTAFKLLLLKPITKREENANKPYPKGAQEFTIILKELEDGLVDRYDKGWRSCSNDLINQYYLLKSTINPVKEAIMKDSALHDSFNDPLIEAVTSSMERLAEIYHYSLAKLDDKVSEERRERRICQSLFNTFQTKIIRDIENVFFKYNSETDGTLTDPWPDQLSDTTCTKTLSGIHGSYTCARTDELRDEKSYLLENEKYLKKLRNVILELDLY